MIKLKLFYLLPLVAFVFSSCNKDEINDLDKRLDKIENRIGDDPVSIKFNTNDDSNADVVKNASYYFKSTDWETSYLWDNGNNTYEVYVERFSDVNWEEGAWVSFDYNATTKVVSNATARAYFRHTDGNYISARFYPGDYVENTVTVTVNSFDAATGKISVKVLATTTANSDNNEYSGKAMTCDFTYKGKLGIFK